MCLMRRNITFKTLAGPLAVFIPSCPLTSGRCMIHDWNPSSHVNVHIFASPGAGRLFVGRVVTDVSTGLFRLRGKAADHEDALVALYPKFGTYCPSDTASPL